MTTFTPRARVIGEESQRLFDALLRALAEPGTIRQLPSTLLRREIPVATWLALALGDTDVDICVADDTDHGASQLVRDATGSRLVELERASIATFETITVEQLERVATGSALQPEAGARVSIRVDAITTAAERVDVVLRLSGPGIPGERMVGLDGIASEVAERLGRASGPFPCGFDTWLMTDSGRMIAIPRSTNVDLVGRETTTTGYC